MKESSKPEFGSPSEAGFSIIEMLIAIVVVTIGLASVVGISAYVSRANSTSNSLNVIAAAAQDQVDRLRTAAWTATAENPIITVGGSLSASSMSRAAAASPSAAQGYGGSVAPQYAYTPDPNNPHHAVASNSPIGNLDISWQVRQGPTPDLRYVTIKVVQIGAPSNMRDGFTVTTMIVRN